jgi:hypothetical protein
MADAGASPSVFGPFPRHLLLELGFAFRHSKHLSKELATPKHVQAAMARAVGASGIWSGIDISRLRMKVLKGALRSNQALHKSDWPRWFQIPVITLANRARANRMRLIAIAVCACARAGTCAHPFKHAYGYARANIDSEVAR